MNETTNLGKNLRALRKLKKLTQSDLAEAAGINQGTVSRIEDGRISNVNEQVLEDLADALDVAISQLRQPAIEDIIETLRN